MIVSEREAGPREDSVTVEELWWSRELSEATGVVPLPELSQVMGPAMAPKTMSKVMWSRAFDIINSNANLQIIELEQTECH